MTDNERIEEIRKRAEITISSLLFELQSDDGTQEHVLCGELRKMRAETNELVAEVARLQAENDRVCEVLAGSNLAIARLQVENAELRTRADAYENEIAAAVPEDVSVGEYCDSVRAELTQARADLDREIKWRVRMDNVALGLTRERDALRNRLANAVEGLREIDRHLDGNPRHDPWECIAAIEGVVSRTLAAITEPKQEE